ncbi:hypothetical protein O1611_g3458 [Lasiodiplodia mahajangana]|uniref:Uncharacterized protein n=1 Tax=Lasiodiplodia mahajangana TaxID=1108764 RepID=A0ACC2JRR9_9PEZI|nr:hypothetical protein O1611_g3458 [Lasiodiplodia mahajangana]
MEKPDPLYNRIDRALATSDFDHRADRFLPEGVIGSLITPDSIKWEVKQKDMSREDAKKKIKWAGSLAEGEFKKVFATAVMMGLRGDHLHRGIEKLKDAGISDRNLPITMSDFYRKEIIPSASRMKDARSDESVGGAGHDKGMENEDDDELFDYLRDDDGDDINEVWTECRAYEFCGKQWLFLSPVFSTANFIHSFDRLCILPFTARHLECDSGTFGQVTKYEIHQSHLISPGNPDFRCPEFVAVKELRAKNKEDSQNILNTWGKEAKALQKMNSLKQPHIVEFYTAFQRGASGNQDHYLMLEWASGGNLRNLWKSFKRPALTDQLVKATVHQLLGLFRAINKAHYPETGPNFRHGHLKPENILWFKDESGRGIGTLKIGDWGLAKQHFRVTEMRSRRTTTQWGTRRYEPPEEANSQGARLLTTDQSGKKRSRLYDIWALGCITLEFLVWLVYGADELDRFNKGLEANNSDNSRFYVIKPGTNGQPEAVVHDVAVEWMKHMAKDPICAPGMTALGNLLDLVETRLLVVKLPERLGSFDDLGHDAKRLGSDIPIIRSSSLSLRDDPVSSSSGAHRLPTIVIDDPESGKTPPRQTIPTRPRFGAPGRERARANELLDHMLIIEGGDEHESYWFIGAPNPPRGPNVDDICQHLKCLPLGSFSAPERISDEWSLLLDNDFAKDVLSSNKQTLRLLRVPVHSELCRSCETLRAKIWEQGFENVYSLQDLKDNLGKCNLCTMIWGKSQKHATAMDSEVTVQRAGSSIKINGEDPPVFSLYRSPGPDTGRNQGIQIGSPNLPEAGSDTYFRILQCWLEHCDHNHKNTTCRPAPQTSSLKDRPTRVIDVGKKGDAKVLLHETQPGDVGEWIALSHQWGEGPKFCTTRANLDHNKNGMDFEVLPETFKHAVIVTRALGRRYLWIDSICVVQGDDGDFNQEAKRMEQVYRGAYCVLASSRSPGHYAGFLQAREQRSTIELQQEGGSGPFYICEAIDDFNHHVLEGSLNKRGWVLQEHALARRTIYFTDYQTYFECGDGVRCETMAKMKNDVAAFLGDPNFPEIIMRASRGEKILRYQDLYKKYSRLGLSEIWDRTTAIGGVQAQILKALDADGGYGVFDEGSKNANNGLLRRSLLWCRDDNTSKMSRIVFPKQHLIAEIPSWSWMAHAGGIDYISPPFGGVDWEKMKSPWSSNMSVGVGKAHTDLQRGSIALVAEASEYNADAAIRVGDGEIILDNPGGSYTPPTECVVLGIKKGMAELKAKDRTHYLLVVTATTRQDINGLPIYERVGAGYLPGKCIKSERHTISIH